MKADCIFKKESDWAGCAYIVLIVLFLSALFCYAMTLNEGYREIDEKNVTLNFSCVLMDDNEFATESARQAIEAVEGVTEVRIFSERNCGELRDSSGDSAALRLEIVPSLEIEGGALVGKKEPWRIRWVDSFPRVYDLELERKGLQSALVAGRYAVGADEAVCSVEILREYGIEDPQSAPGRKITLTRWHWDETYVCEKTIVGVVNERIREVSQEGVNPAPALYLSTKDRESITSLFGRRPEYYVFYDSHESKAAGLSRLRAVLPEGCDVASQDPSFGVGGVAQQRQIAVPILSAVCALLCAGLWFAFLKNVTQEIEASSTDLDPQLSDMKAPVVLEAVMTMIKGVLATAFGLAFGALVIFGAAHFVSAHAGWCFCGNYKLLLGALGIDLGVSALLSVSAAWATHRALKKKKA